MFLISCLILPWGHQNCAHQQQQKCGSVMELERQIVDGVEFFLKLQVRRQRWKSRQHFCALIFESWPFVFSGIRSFFLLRKIYTLCVTFEELCINFLNMFASTMCATYSHECKFFFLHFVAAAKILHFIAISVLTWSPQI